MELGGKPRSIAEIEFIAGMQPCERCGDRTPTALFVGGVGTRWVVRSTCARCRTEREVVFSSGDDLFAIDHPSRELGNAEPSDILAPVDLIAEIDRLAPTIVTVPARLQDPEWNENADRVERILTALNELEKFIPVDSERVPDSAHDELGRRDQRMRPERYSRPWIHAERAHWLAVMDEIAEDAPRIFAADPILARTTPPRGLLDGTTVMAHGQWLDRGRRGSGRLDVVTADLDELDLGAARLTAVRFEGIYLRGAQLRGAQLDDGELIEVVLDGAELAHASFAAARISASSFAAARLEHSRWAGATVERSSFRGARLAHAQLQGATFVECDFRAAELTHCDLTDATLERCLFAGAFGTPAKIDGAIVIDADFDANALLIEIAD